jgi:hypothetical protein
MTLSCPGKITYMHACRYTATSQPSVDRDGVRE